MATASEISSNSQINGHVNGHTDYGEVAVKALVHEEKEEKSSVAKLSKEHDIVLKTYRILIADLCEQFGGGHPGSAIGMAAIGVALWKYTMQYAPHTPDWLNRGQLAAPKGIRYSWAYCTGRSIRPLKWPCLPISIRIPPFDRIQGDDFRAAQVIPQ